MIPRGAGRLWLVEVKARATVSPERKHSRSTSSSHRCSGPDGRASPWQPGVAHRTQARIDGERDVIVGYRNALLDAEQRLALACNDEGAT